MHKGSPKQLCNRFGVAMGPRFAPPPDLLFPAHFRARPSAAIRPKDSDVRPTGPHLDCAHHDRALFLILTLYNRFAWFRSDLANQADFFGVGH